MKYFKSEKALLKFKRKNKIFGWFTYVKQVMIRFTVQVLMTNGMRCWFYKTFARKKVKKDKKGTRSTILSTTKAKKYMITASEGVDLRKKVFEENKDKYQNKEKR